MPISPMDIATLSSPLPVPGTVSEQIGAGMDTSPFTPRQQAVNTALSSGAGVTNPYGTGNVPNPIDSTELAGTAHLTSGGATVGGVTGMTSPEAPKEIMLDGEKVDDYTGEENAITTKKRAIQNARLEAKKQEEEKQEQFISDLHDANNSYRGMEGARGVRKDLKDADKEFIKQSGLTGKEKREMKRKLKDNRKDSWKTFKENKS